MSQMDSSLDLPAGMFRPGENVKETTMMMARRIVGPVNVDVKYAVVSDTDGDLALFEGDIVLGSAADARGANSADRGVGVLPEFRWPSGIIPYVTTEVLRPRVEAAIAHWEKHTPFRFIKRTNESDHLSFEARDGCWSSVGRRGGKQVISLASGCGLGSAIHEIGHALGLWHEQSRSDRDNFIEIVVANIDPQQLHNFDKHVLDGVDLGNYDFGSIMHYPATAFSINGQPTIRTKDGRDIGQRNGLSQGDIAAIRLMYPDLNWPA